MAVAAMTNAICPGGLPVLMNMLVSDNSSVRSDGIKLSWMLVDRLGNSAFISDEAAKAGLAQALVNLLPAQMRCNTDLD